jgi:hypothetical protein
LNMTWYELYKSPIRSQITKMNLFWYMIKNNRCYQRWKEEHVIGSINTGMPQGRWLTNAMSQDRGKKKQTPKRAHSGVGLNLMIFQQQIILYLAPSPYQCALHYYYYYLQQVFSAF